MLEPAASGTLLAECPAPHMLRSASCDGGAADLAGPGRSMCRCAKRTLRNPDAKCSATGPAGARKLWCEVRTLCIGSPGRPISRKHLRTSGCRQQFGGRS